MHRVLFINVRAINKFALVEREKNGIYMSLKNKPHTRMWVSLCFCVEVGAIRKTILDENKLFVFGTILLRKQDIEAPKRI